MTGSCWCGGCADLCAHLDRHTGGEERASTSAAYDFGSCARGCGSWSVGPSGVCAACASAERRAYFASPAARELAAAVLGTSAPAVATVVELPLRAPSRRAA